MPTDLPLRRTMPPQRTREGTLFFAAAVVLMLTISAVVVIQGQREEASTIEASQAAGS